MSGNNRSDFYIRRFEYARYYPIIGLRHSGIIHGIAVFKQYWYGQRVDRCAYPYNPKTEKQQCWRAYYAQGVRVWQGMDDQTKQFYNFQANKHCYSGYNRYLQLYLKTVSQYMAGF